MPTTIGDACGMCLSFGLIALALTRKQARFLLALPPTWYLYAWAGHYMFQADVPAVFTYGMTLRGWASGELCSVLALVNGRTVGRRGPNASRGHEEWLLTAALIVAYVLAARLPAWWQVARAAPKGKAE